MGAKTTKFFNHWIGRKDIKISVDINLGDRLLNFLHQSGKANKYGQYYHPADTDCKKPASMV